MFECNNISEVYRKICCCTLVFFFFSSRRRHTRFDCDWSSDVCSSDLNAAISGSGLTYQVQLTADREGWGYMRLSDPGQSRLKIQSVVRSDGKVLNPHNTWTNFRYDPSSNARSDYLNIFDLVELKDYNYAVTYAASAVDTNAPVTTLNFAGVVTQVGGKYYITPDTQMFFLSDDISPVSIVYSLTNGPFVRL